MLTQNADATTVVTRDCYVHIYDTTQLNSRQLRHVSVLFLGLDMNYWP